MSEFCSLMLVFYVGTPSGVHLFGHLLWPIFQSSIFTHYIIQVFKFLQILVDLCGQLSCTASISYLIFWKIISLAGIRTADLGRGKPLTYQCARWPTFSPVLNLSIVYTISILHQESFGSVPSFDKLSLWLVHKFADKHRPCYLSLSHISICQWLLPYISM